jgi:hypothetical protein
MKRPTHWSKEWEGALSHSGLAMLTEEAAGTLSGKYCRANRAARQPAK